MNIYAKVKEQSSKRMLILLVAAGIAGYAIAGLVGLVWGVATAIAVPMVLAVGAFFWVTAAEWTKLGVAELYGTAAQKKMEEAASRDLRESLDAIGQEAFDELERAISRRDEESS